MTTTQQMIKRSGATVYRRAFLKRRTVAASGAYETDWQDITADVKKWGTIKFEMEEERLNRFKLSGTSLTVKNDDGKYNPNDDSDSFWNTFLSSYKTRMKIEAGFIDEAGVEVPVNNVMFEGVITDDIDLTNDNDANLRAQSLMAAFKDVTASRVTGLTGAQTASEIVVFFRDLEDSNNVKIFENFISAGAWNIASTSNIYNDLASSSDLDDKNVYEVLVQLAEAENLAVWVDPDGTFNFDSKVVNTTTVQWKFQGPTVTDKAYGTTIKSIESFKDAISKVFTRIRVRIDEADGSASFRTIQESWNVGDSSTSWQYGERTFEFENTWLNTVTADTVIANMQTSLSVVKREVRIRTKFMPQLKLLDLVTVDYVNATALENDTIWGNFLWGKKLWRGVSGPRFKIQGDYQVRGIQHNIDNFETQFFLREN